MKYYPTLNEPEPSQELEPVMKFAWNRGRKIKKTSSDNARKITVFLNLSGKNFLK